MAMGQVLIRKKIMWRLLSKMCEYINIYDVLIASEPKNTNIKTISRSHFIIIIFVCREN